MPAELAALALEAATFDCVTSPSFPGLATRIDNAMLHWTQTDGIAAVGAGAPPGHSHCQFQIQTVDPAGGGGTTGTVDGSQFQLQFQIQTSGGVTAASCAESGVIPDELSLAVLPPVSAATAPGDAASGAGAAPEEAAAACGAAGRAAGPVVVPTDDTTAGAGAGTDAACGPTVGAAGDTTGGIAVETTFEGDSGTARTPAGAATTTVGTGGATGAGMTIAGTVTGIGRTGMTMPLSANAEGAAAAASASTATTRQTRLATLPS